MRGMSRLAAPSLPSRISVNKSVTWPSGGDMLSPDKGIIHFISAGRIGRARQLQLIMRELRGKGSNLRSMDNQSEVQHVRRPIRATGAARQGRKVILWVELRRGGGVVHTVVAGDPNRLHPQPKNSPNSPLQESVN